MKTSTLVDQYLKAREGQLSPSALARTGRALKKFSDSCPELPQRPDIIFKFLGTVGNTPSTREQYKWWLSGFYTWASSQDGIVNPMPRVKVPQRRAKVSRNEKAALGAVNTAYEHGGGQTSAVMDQRLQRIEFALARLLPSSSGGVTVAAPSAAAPLEILTAQAVADFDNELLHGSKPRKQTTVDWYHATLNELASRYKYLPMDGNELGRFIGSAPTQNWGYMYSRSLVFFYNTLARIYGWRRQGIFNPIEEMQRASPDYKVVPPLQAEEMEKILGVARLEQSDIRGMVLLLATTGVRPVEVYTLKTCDFYGTQIQVSGKTQPRMVTLLPPLLQLLAGLHPVSASPVPVFDRIQQEWEHSSLDWWLEKVMKAAGVRGGKGGGRLFRHTVASWLYTLTNDPFLVQQVLGHTKLDMSRHYAKMRMPKTAEAPLWYELITAAAACHKLETVTVSPQLQALFQGQEYHPAPIHTEVSTQYQQQYGERKKSTHRLATRKFTPQQISIFDILEVPHGQAEELARSQ